MRPLIPNKKKAFWILGVCTLALAAEGLWWTRPPNALERATKVVTVPEWRSSNRSTIESYLWLTNKDLLISKPNAQNQERLFRGSVDKQPLELKPDSLAKPIDMWERMFNSNRFSPYGEWATISEYTVNFYRLYVFQTGDQTRRRYEFKRDQSSQSFLEPFWSQDSKTLYSIEWATRKLHRLRPDIDAEETLPIQILPNSLPNIKDTSIVGISNAGLLIIQKQHLPTAIGMRAIFEFPDMLELYAVGFGADKTFSRIGSIPLRQNESEVNVPLLKLSPKGDRLFLGVASVRHSPFLDWLHKRISWLPDGNYGIEQGWVMNLDGSGKHLIGEFTAPFGNRKEHPWIVEPEWTPDGKKISFLYDDGIYTIPAD